MKGLEGKTLLSAEHKTQNTKHKTQQELYPCSKQE